jgi:hypothetical protein
VQKYKKYQRGLVAVLQAEARPVANRQSKATPTPKRERLTLAPRLLIKPGRFLQMGPLANAVMRKKICAMLPELFTPTAQM